MSCPGARVEDEVKAAVGVGADGLVLQGLKTSTITRPEGLLDYCRVPIIAGIPRAREALRERRVLGEVSLISATGTRNGADASKALALGADAVRIDEAALIALGYYNSSSEIAEEGRPNRKIEPGTGIRVAKFINSMTMEIALLARSLGKGDVHSLEYEDLSYGLREWFRGFVRKHMGRPNLSPNTRDGPNSPVIAPQKFRSGC